MDQAQERRRSRIPWIVLAVAAPVFVFTLVISVLNHTLAEGFTFIALSMIVGYAGVGTLVASREPGNPIGWVMMLMGLGFLLTGLSDEAVTYTYLTNPGAIPVGPLWASLTNWTFLLALGPAPLLIAIFPNGHVASPRWRFLPIAWAIALTGGIVATMFDAGQIDHEHVVVDNPLGIASLDGVFTLMGAVCGIALLVIVALAVTSMILRFRRSRGEERQQLRWFAYASLTAMVLLFLSFGQEWVAGPTTTEIFFFAFFIVFALGIPASVGVAVLRYRLYDLDLVVKKAVVFAVLVVLLFVLGSAVVLVASTPVFERIGDTPTLVAAVGVAIGLAVRPLYRLARRIADRLVYGGRANPYEVLAGFTDRMGESYATDDVLPRMASILHDAVGASTARVWLAVGSQLRPAAVAPGDAEPAEPLDAPTDALPPIPSEDAFEVRHQGDLLGALSVSMPANDPMNPSKERLVQDLAAQAGLVLRNVRLIEDLRDSRRRIVAAQDERARKLERDIHDGAQQQLVALAVQLRLAISLIERDPAKATELLHALEGTAGQALDDLRDLARGIYPPLLADQGLPAAISAQARKAALPVEVRADGVGRYGQEVEASIYFCTLEALNNVAKYARATTVTIDVAQPDGRLTFAIRDDGAGFDPATATRGTGLQGMTDRVEAVGGTLRIESRPGEGTTVSGSVPVRNARRLSHERAADAFGGPRAGALRPLHAGAVEFLGHLRERQPLLDHLGDPGAPRVVLQVAALVREADVPRVLVAAVRPEDRVVIDRGVPLGVRDRWLREVLAAVRAVALRRLAQELDQLARFGHRDEHALLDADRAQLVDDSLASRALLRIEVDHRDAVPGS